MNRLISSAIASVIALAILMSTLFVVDQRQFAIVFALGEVKEVIKEPGLHFKLPPPFQNVIFLDKRILTLDTPEPDRFITAEKKTFWSMPLLNGASLIHDSTSSALVVTSVAHKIVWHKLLKQL